MSTTVAFIGLGVMGYPMAGYLAKAGHTVRVYNRTIAKAEKWVAEYGGSCYSTPASATEGASIVMACVGNDDDIRQVTIGVNGVEFRRSANLDKTPTKTARLDEELR